MTIAIGLHLGSYVMLAADTRITSYPPGRSPLYRDDHEKIRRTNIGLATGAGHVQLLAAVEHRLETDQILNTNDFLRIVREEWQTHLIPEVIDLPNNQKATGWLFTYHTRDGDSAKLRLAIIHPSIADGESVGCYGEGDVALISPAEATPEQAEGFHKVLREQMKTPLQVAAIGDENELQQHLAHHWMVVAHLIKFLNPYFPSISDKVQIGVHLITGQCGVSPITSIDDPNFTLCLSA